MKEQEAKTEQRKVNGDYDFKQTLKLLDFDEIKRELIEYAISEEVKDNMANLEIHKDYYLITRHLRETTEARAILDVAGTVPLHSLSGIKQIIEKLNRHEILRITEISSLSLFIKDTSKMRSFMLERVENTSSVSNYALGIDLLTAVYDELTRCVNTDQIDDNASSLLSKLRKRIDITEHKVKLKLQDYLIGSKFQGMLTDPIISQRDGRFVIPVKSEHKRNIEGLVLDRSRSGGTVFVEPAAVKKLSDELAQLRIDEENEVYRILSELTNLLASHKIQLYRNYEVMVTYDFLFAKARLSRKYQASPAEVSQNGRLKIVEGRHPLLGAQAVPLNLELDHKNRNLVITGPNTGGKTVAMKTVGLFCLMNQAGLHVPCGKETALPIFDKILCDIGDGQNVQQNLSTFSAHITNIIKIMAQADNRSLVILDEIGAGTDPSEGMGIGIAVLERLNKKGAYILTSTHYNEIKAFADRHPDFKNGSMAFDLKTISPLYKLNVGKSGESNALHIALRIGMPEDLISRAHEIAYKEQHDYSDFNASYERALTASEAEVEELLSESAEASEVVSANVSGHVSEKSSKNKVESQFAPRKISPYKEGDAVYITTMNKNGIVYERENAKGDVGVIVLGKRIKVNYKRLKPFIDSSELYPEAYDLDIVFESKENRKKNKLITKGKGKGLVIEKKGNQ
ncbi:endonuclease MutS2 [Fusibacter bizertensis]